MSGDRFAEPADTATPVPPLDAGKLMNAASPLLAAAIRLASASGQAPDIAQLRRAMVQGVRDFERQALASGLDTRSLRASRYALCATIDDLVLSTPWGAASMWPQRSLVSTFHNEASGGERFYDILEQMRRDLARHVEAVELMYLCMALGFEGRYRGLPHGRAAMSELREGVYRAIRTRRGAPERELSPHWRGRAAAARRLSQIIPLWAVGLAMAGLALLIYAALDFALAGRSDVAFAELASLPPRGATVIPRVEAAAPPPPVPPSPAAMAVVAKLRQILAREIKAGLATVLDDQQAVTIRLAGRDMFAPGQAVLYPAFEQALGRVGDAIQGERGAVMVNAYTDDRPIRTLRFPSGFDLSQARADAAARLIAARLSDPARVHAIGHAGDDPMAQQNRRTEIVLVREGSK